MVTAERVIFETTTDIDQYTVIERQYEGRPARVLFSGIRRAAQSGIGLDDNPDLLFDYNQRLLELANGVYPKKILVIGGGAYTLPTALVTALPDATVDVVELDAQLETIAREYFGLPTNERLRLYSGDGRAFIAQTSQTYDLIIIDVFSELQIPEQFLTLEFVQQLKARLRKDGCVAFNIIASYQGRNAGLIKSQVAAYSAEFERVDVFPAAYGLTSWLPQNLVLVAQKGIEYDLLPYLRFAPLKPVEAVETDIRHDTDAVT